MSEPQRDTSGDYGYDLAHEATARAKAPEPDSGHQPRTTVHPGGTADRDEDYAYDEAHDF